MSNINTLMNAGATSVTGNNVYQSTLSKMNDKLDEINADETLSDEQKQKKLDELNSQISSVSTQAASSTSGSDSMLMNSMLGNYSSDDNPFSTNLLFGAGNTLQNVMSLYKAGIGIQKEARILASEIRLDKIRGVDTADKEKKLTNLTENVSILNKSLNSQIDSALADEETDAETISVIDKIKAELEANQKELDARREAKEADKAGTDTTTESQEKSE